jgi:hypothetical protein
MLACVNGIMTFGGGGLPKGKGLEDTELTSKLTQISSQLMT